MMFISVILSAVVISLTLGNDQSCVKRIMENSPKVCHPRATEHFAGEMAFDEWTDVIAADFGAYAELMVAKVRLRGQEITIKDGNLCRNRKVEVDQLTPKTRENVVETIFATVAKLPYKLPQTFPKASECNKDGITNILSSDLQVEGSNNYPHICQVSTKLKMVEFVWRLFRWVIDAVKSDPTTSSGPAHSVKDYSGELLMFFLPQMNNCWRDNILTIPQILEVLSAMRASAVKYKIHASGLVLTPIDSKDVKGLQDFVFSCLPSEERSCVLGAHDEVRLEYLGPQIMRTLSYYFVTFGGMHDHDIFIQTPSMSTTTYLLHNLKDDPEDVKDEFAILMSDPRVTAIAMKRFIDGTGIGIPYHMFYNELLGTGETIDVSTITVAFLRVISRHELCNVCYLAAITEFIRICAMVVKNTTGTPSTSWSRRIPALNSIIKKPDYEPALPETDFLTLLLKNFNIYHAIWFLRNELHKNS